MTDTKPFYDDEAVLLSWGESANDGAWIKLQITEDTVPFLRGLKRGSEHGERFTMVLHGPLQNDETVSASAPTRGRVGPQKPSRDSAATAKQDQPATKPKQKWSDLRPSARAAMLLETEGFDEFAREHGSYIGKPSTEAWLLERCGAPRKRDIDQTAGPGSPRARLEAIEGNFRAWQQARGHSAA